MFSVKSSSPEPSSPSCTQICHRRCRHESPVQCYGVGKWVEGKRDGESNEELGREGLYRIVQRAEEEGVVDSLQVQSTSTESWTAVPLRKGWWLATSTDFKWRGLATASQQVLLQLQPIVLTVFKPHLSKVDYHLIKGLQTNNLTFIFQKVCCWETKLVTNNMAKFLSTLSKQFNPFESKFGESKRLV